VSYTEQLKADLQAIITQVESHGPEAQRRTEAFEWASTRFEELVSGSTKWQAEDGVTEIREAAQYVFNAEGKSEIVRMAVERMINAL